MKADKRIILWVIVITVVAAGIIIAMFYQTGIFSNESEVVQLEKVEMKAPTNTPAPAQGWWDEKTYTGIVAVKEK